MFEATAVAWRLHKTYKTYKTYKIMVGEVRLRPDGLRRGKPCDTPRVCGAAVWFGSGEGVPQGYAVITAARHKEPAAVPTGKSVRYF